MANTVPFQVFNSSLPPPNHTSSSFSLTASPSTDIWAQPSPLKTPFNAPLIYKHIPLSSFLRARVSISIPESFGQEYDQAGLIFILPSLSSKREGEGEGGEENRYKWIKTGIEIIKGKKWISVVAKDSWADWSMIPFQNRDEKEGEIVMEMKKVKGKMWVFRVEMGEEGEEMVPVREVTWVFGEGEEEREAWVGVWVARPSSEGGELGVAFRGWELEGEGDR